MTRNIRRLSLICSAVLIGCGVIAVAPPAQAQGQRGGDNHDNNDNRDYRRQPQRWDRGYDRGPPVVYGSPYGYGYRYGYAPPLVYGPGVGIMLPGINLNIR